MPRGTEKNSTVKPIKLLSGLIATLGLTLALIMPVSAQVIITDATEGSLTISWLAPGDDGNRGTAAVYEIRYDTVPVTLANWSSATVLANPPTPAVSGTEQSYVLSGIYLDQTVYVALRAADEAGNWSDLTNSVQLIPVEDSITVLVDSSAQGAVLQAPLASYTGSLDYLFQLDSSGSFTNPVTKQGVPYASGYQAHYDTLVSAKFYYGRYRTISPDSIAGSYFSLSEEVDLLDGLLPGQPSPPFLYAPINGEPVATTAPTLEVVNGIDPDGDNLTYQFELFDASHRTLLVWDSSVAEGSQMTSWSVPDGILELENYYFWRARTFDGSQYSPWAFSQRFLVTELSTGTETGGTLQDPYPSPVRFASGEEITFTLPDDLTEIHILNSAGELVLAVGNKSVSWSWDGRNGNGQIVGPGVYLWYLSDKNNFGKFVVLP